MISNHDLYMEYFCEDTACSKEHAKIYLDHSRWDYAVAINTWCSMVKKDYVYVPITLVKSNASHSISKVIHSLHGSETTKQEKETTLPQHVHLVKFYINGFTVDGGDLCSYDTEKNKKFLQDIQNGMLDGSCPEEFLKGLEPNSDVRIRIERRNVLWTPFEISRSPEISVVQDTTPCGTVVSTDTTRRSLVKVSFDTGHTFMLTLDQDESLSTLDKICRRLLGLDRRAQIELTQLGSPPIKLPIDPSKTISSENLSSSRLHATTKQIDL